MVNSMFSQYCMQLITDCNVVTVTCAQVVQYLVAEYDCAARNHTQPDDLPASMAANPTYDDSSHH